MISKFFFALKALKRLNADPVRNDILIDLYTEAHDGSSMIAFRYSDINLSFRYNFSEYSFDL